MKSRSTKDRVFSFFPALVLVFAGLAVFLSVLFPVQGSSGNSSGSSADVKKGTVTGDFFGTCPSEDIDIADITRSPAAQAHPMSSVRLPHVWDNRWIGRTGTIRNQGDLSTCWAFASLGALQASLLPSETNDFSVDHMRTYSGFSSAAEGGGTLAMALAYLTAWRGPVYETDDPYNDGHSNPLAAVRFHLQEAQFLNNDQNAIKLAVLRCGAVQSSMYADEGLVSTGTSTLFYQAETNSYFYNGSEKANHDIMIVGWDDDYPAGNFAITPPRNGAFLCQNSWGTSFGDEGFFYVSYYDTRLMNYAIVYSRIDGPDNYDGIYQHDDLGWVAQMGYGTLSAWGANRFLARSDAELKAVAFYAITPNVHYEVYVDLSPDEGFSHRTLAASGSFANAGYYTIDLTGTYALTQGQPFAIVIKLTQTSPGNPLAVETRGDGINAIIGTGETYLSADGSSWTDAGESLGCNLCLKAFVSGKDGS